VRQSRLHSGERPIGARHLCAEGCAGKLDTREDPGGHERRTSVRIDLARPINGLILYGHGGARPRRGQSCSSTISTVRQEARAAIRFAAGDLDAGPSPVPDSAVTR